MSIHFFPNAGLKRWDIFVPVSISFNNLCSSIHRQSQLSDCPTDCLYIYIGVECQIADIEVLENFEILFLHSDIKEIYFVINDNNIQISMIHRAVKFMSEVYLYNVHLIKSENLVDQFLY